MLLTINDQTHVLIVCCVILIVITGFYVLDLIHDDYASPAFGFLFAAIVLQAYNGLLLHYGVHWNIESTTITWIMMIVVGVLSRNLFKGMLESFSMMLGAAFLIVVVVAGQDYVLNWFNNLFGSNFSYFVILTIASVLMVVLWYLNTKITSTRVYAIFLTSIILIAGCTLSFKILIAGGAWQMWDAHSFDVEMFDDWFYIILGSNTFVYCFLYQYVYRSKPHHSAKRKLNHAHLHTPKPAPPIPDTKWFDMEKIGEENQLLTKT